MYKGPDFLDISYDDRNHADAGKERGVGMPGKIGSHDNNSEDDEEER